MQPILTMRFPTLIPVLAILFTLSTYGQSSTLVSSSIQHNLILDTDLGFGPMAAGLMEGSTGIEWFKAESPEKRWSLKANFGQGDIFLIPITDSGDWNGTSNVYSLEALYAQDFYRWEGKPFDADKVGYMRHSLFFETGLLGGYGDQHITHLGSRSPHGSRTQRSIPRCEGRPRL